MKDPDNIKTGFCPAWPTNGSEPSVIIQNSLRTLSWAFSPSQQIICANHLSWFINGENGFVLKASHKVAIDWDSVITIRFFKESKFLEEHCYAIHSMVKDTTELFKRWIHPGWYIYHNYRLCCFDSRDSRSCRPQCTLWTSQWYMVYTGAWERIMHSDNFRIKERKIPLWSIFKNTVIT